MEKLEGIEDLVYLVREKQANQDQIEDFTRQTQMLLNRYLGRKLGGSNHFEDVMSKTILDVWEKLNHYDRKKSGFSTWLFRVACTSIAEYFKKDNYSKRHLDEEVTNGKKFLDYQKHFVQRNTLSNDIDIKYDMLCVIKDLFKRYKDKRDMLLAIFNGDPFEQGYEIGFNDSLVEVANKTGKSWVQVRWFLIEKVYPYMKKVLSNYNA